MSQKQKPIVRPSVLQLARDSQMYIDVQQIDAPEFEWESLLEGEPEDKLIDSFIYNPETKECYFPTSPVRSNRKDEPLHTPISYDGCYCDLCRTSTNQEPLTSTEKAEREEQWKALEAVQVEWVKARREENIRRARRKAELQVERARRVVEVALGLGVGDIRKWENDEGEQRKKELLDERAKFYWGMEFKAYH